MSVYPSNESTTERERNEYRTNKIRDKIQCRSIGEDNEIVSPGCSGTRILVVPLVPAR